MTIIIPKRVRERAVQDCKSIEEFASKYRKAQYYTAKGRAHAQAVIDSHQTDIDILGFTTISEQESITGKLEYFVPPETTEQLPVKDSE